MLTNTELEAGRPGVRRALLVTLRHRTRHTDAALLNLALINQGPHFTRLAAHVLASLRAAPPTMLETSPPARS